MPERAELRDCTLPAKELAVAVSSVLQILQTYRAALEAMERDRVQPRHSAMWSMVRPFGAPRRPLGHEAASARGGCASQTPHATR